MKQADTITNFDPEKFLVVAEKKFDDLKIGDIFRAPSRTLTDAHAVAFQSVSADNHPVHYDSVWAARHGHSAPVVHGLQVLATVTPMLAPATRRRRPEAPSGANLPRSVKGIPPGWAMTPEPRAGSIKGCRKYGRSSWAPAPRRCMSGRANSSSAVGKRRRSH